MTSSKNKRKIEAEDLPESWQLSLVKLDTATFLSESLQLQQKEVNRNRSYFWRFNINSIWEICSMMVRDALDSKCGSRKPTGTYSGLKRRPILVQQAHLHDEDTYQVLQYKENTVVIKKSGCAIYAPDGHLVAECKAFGFDGIWTLLGVAIWRFGSKAYGQPKYIDLEHAISEKKIQVATLSSYLPNTHSFYGRACFLSKSVVVYLGHSYLDVLAQYKLHLMEILPKKVIGYDHLAFKELQTISIEDLCKKDPSISWTEKVSHVKEQTLFGIAETTMLVRMCYSRDSEWKCITVIAEVNSISGPRQFSLVSCTMEEVSNKASVQ